jgi:hypothetical protein
MAARQSLTNKNSLGAERAMGGSNHDGGIDNDIVPGGSSFALAGPDGSGGRDRAGVVVL